ncbi:hypothetical protein [Streptomyces sp. V1I1]|uniref:hypothetical protein n=1 Tax=Streptomyces sp. V1I1 TaxID=3042272 RepID=UPI002784F01D|nr:hypothetical protein [Streptomyces sp. V1I1]MDQ0944180.1 hypothetical protein [Streptomyces sp. V1I1]
MSDVRAAAGPQTIAIVAPLRRAGGEANEKGAAGDVRAAAGPQTIAIVAPLRRAGGEANEKGAATP